MICAECNTYESGGPAYKTPGVICGRCKQLRRKPLPPLPRPVPTAQDLFGDDWSDGYNAWDCGGDLGDK